MLVVNAASLLGIILLSADTKALARHLHVLISFAIGDLFGDAFIHLIPEAFAAAQDPLPVSLLILAGMLLFFLVERYILWRHAGHGHGHHGLGRGHHLVGAEHDHDHGLRPVVILNLIGDGVHNLVDGLLIGAGFLVSPAIGVTTSVAVLLHEIPQEIGDFGILVHGGLSPRKALGFNLLSSLFATLGVIISLLIGPDFAGYADAMLPITAGGFIYIAGTLIPDLRKETRLGAIGLDFAAMLTGAGIMALLTKLH